MTNLVPLKVGPVNPQFNALAVLKLVFDFVPGHPPPPGGLGGGFGADVIFSFGAVESVSRANLR